VHPELNTCTHLTGQAKKKIKMDLRIASNLPEEHEQLIRRVIGAAIEVYRIKDRPHYQFQRAAT
jgi:hypothetical protein